ncbi:MAG: AzlD domain-containing protein [Rhizobiales bacterium]|nr:AzlD domain-containing protein [Hyphomicrobiales bacterium]
MSGEAILPAGAAGYAVILIAGVLMTEPWRWAGALLARDIDVDSEIFRWVKAVSTALVAGLVARMVVFPSGALAEVALASRVGAFLVSVGVFLGLAGRLAYGVRIIVSVLAGLACLALAIVLGA